MYRWQDGRKPIKKFNRLTMAILVLLLVYSMIQIIIPTKSVATYSNTYVQYTVSHGDTLWSIAKQHRGHHRDIRDAVAEIREVNGIDPVIRPGQVIWVMGVE